MVQIFTDGAAMGNPGKAGIGIIIKNNDQLTNSTYSHFIDIKDTHQAEYIAILYALKLAKQQQFNTVILYSDSKTVVDSIEKQYIKQTLYQPLLNHILNLAQTFDMFFIKWLPRDQNKGADALAKQALHTQQYNKKIKDLEHL